MSARCSRAEGLSCRSLGAPDQTVDSLSASRSRSTPPNTMAPRRPLPTGSASSQRVEGVRYQSDSACSALRPVSDARARARHTVSNARVSRCRFAPHACPEAPFPLTLTPEERESLGPRFELAEHA